MDKFNILIVDDDEIIRKNLVNYLTNYHKANYILSVFAAKNANEALKLIEEYDFELMLADINMPDQSGFELINKVKSLFPKIKSALITAYKVEDYLKLAKENGISNIIVKTSPFNFNELSKTINGLIFPDKYLFNIENYLNNNANLSEFTLENTENISKIQSKLRSKLQMLNIPNIELVSIAFLEALTNALYYASETQKGEKKYIRGEYIKSIDTKDHVCIKFGDDGETFGLSIVDNGGKLTKNEILYWLERNFSGSGLLDNHGRGFYLMHTIVDRLIINIKTNEKTEIIFLIYLNQKFIGHKPIYINEI